MSGGYDLYRGVVHPPAGRFKRWTLELTIEGDGCIAMEYVSETGRKASWSQRGIERKARRALRARRREQQKSYELWRVQG